MLETLLIANRGEIACRIIRTARRMGMRTVAVYSEADRDARHVRAADEAILIGPSPARESYLVSERILSAAKTSHADAIHPGYGFLSENADFAEACTRAGHTFVGPTAPSIRAMGLKDEAKRRMEAAGVPVVPGEYGDTEDAQTLARAADQIGYPVLVKAVAGGGGKGMRRVNAPEDLEKALEGARREAQSAFGDGRVLIEKWLGSSRHIEVQVFADNHGEVVHLFERDCSLQRRHQKVVEESPAPGMPEKMRKAMGEASVKAARAIDYRGAGTIEYLVDVSNGLEGAPFYFMEMNTRLQVEHPVTEAITGIDLVEWQLRIAAGEPLPKKQEDLSIRGHAVEVRVYAEDPARRYLPQIGTLVRHRPPGEDEHVRVDNGIDEGGAVTIHYDPMISKLITHADTREQALLLLRSALERYQIAGLISNLGLLHAISRHPAFVAGQIDTSFLDEHGTSLVSTSPQTESQLVALACVTHLMQRREGPHPTLDSDPHSPWAATDCFRLNEDGFDILRFRQQKQELEVKVHFSQDALTLEWNDQAMVVHNPGLTEDRVHATLNGERIEGFYAKSEEAIWVMRHASALALKEIFDSSKVDLKSLSGGTIRAPMPGRIAAVLVSADERVKQGQPLLVLEAMKMEHTLTAPKAGTVEQLDARNNLQVEEGDLLLVVG